MASKQRVDAPGVIQHVTFHATGNDLLCRDVHDYRAVVQTFVEVATTLEWMLLAVCVMPNHVHALIRPTHANMANGMLRVGTRVAKRYNRRYDRRGALLREPYHPELVQTDGHLLECFRYFDLNPVRARLCSRPEGWPWSSHSAIAGLPRHEPIAVDPAFALGLFGGDAATRRRRYREFVLAGLRPGRGGADEWRPGAS